MNKFAAITFAALCAIFALVALAQASGYGGQSYGGQSYGGGHGGYSAPSYGQNYERKTGFKTVSSSPVRLSVNCQLLAPMLHHQA